MTGYPLVKSMSMICKISDKGALRDYYHEYVSVSNHDPWFKSMAGY